MLVHVAYAGLDTAEDATGTETLDLAELADEGAVLGGVGGGPAGGVAAARPPLEGRGKALLAAHPAVRALLSADRRLGEVQSPRPQSGTLYTGCRAGGILLKRIGLETATEIISFIESSPATTVNLIFVNLGGRL